MHILITGGAGYIGSHTCLELLNAGHSLTVIDNLSNSKITSLERVQEITGMNLSFHRLDLLDLDGMQRIFDLAPVEAVIHFAGLKAPGESVKKPLEYYHNNVTGTLNLLEAMSAHGVKDIIFSSSCTVYGDAKTLPITEDLPLSPINPYGRTKLMVEQILEDLQAAQPDWNVILLRYFNPVGAHPSGRIGEDPLGIPINLFPVIAQVATGRLPYLGVFGNDYPTPDGTCIRDYIHVVDLALGHLKALNLLPKNPGLAVYNLGTGRGYSVLEVHAAFEKAIGRSLPHRILPRRPGDAPVAYADPSKAQRELGWRAQLDLERMVADMWRWQSGNPQGYAQA